MGPRQEGSGRQRGCLGPWTWLGQVRWGQEEGSCPRAGALPAASLCLWGGASCTRGRHYITRAGAAGATSHAW